MIQKQFPKQCSNINKEYKYNPLVVKHTKKHTTYSFKTKSGGEIKFKIKFPHSKLAKKIRDVFFKSIGVYDGKKRKKYRK